LAGAILFPKGYSEQIRAGDSPSLPVLVDAGQNIYPRIIGIVAREFGDGVLAVQIATRIALEARPVSQANGPDLDAAGLAAEVGRRIVAMTGAPAEEAARKGAKTTPFQYYAAAMSTMFLLFAGQAGLESISGERRQMTLLRLLATPGAARGFAAGKFLGILAVAFTQFLILLLGTSLVFGVDWGPSVAATLAVGLGYASAIAGLAVMVSVLATNGKTAATWWLLATQAFSALGGSLWPLTFFPPAVERIASFLPNYWALRGFLGVMAGDTLAQAAPAALAMAGFGLAALLVGSRRLART
jgi:ABC-2 type transport system permease protein